MESKGRTKVFVLLSTTVADQVLFWEVDFSNRDEYDSYETVGSIRPSHNFLTLLDFPDCDIAHGPRWPTVTS